MNLEDMKSWAEVVGAEVEERPLVTADDSFDGFWIDRIFVTKDFYEEDLCSLTYRAEMSQEEIEAIEDGLSDEEKQELFAILDRKLRDRSTTVEALWDPTERFAGFQVHRILTGESNQPKQDFIDALIHVQHVGRQGLEVLQESLNEDTVGQELSRHREMFG